MKDLLTFVFCLALSFNVLGQASLSGQVADKDTGEPILFGDVIVYRNGNLVTGAQTDFDGNYTISPIDAGTYEIAFKYVGYTDLKIEKVKFGANETVIVDAAIKSQRTICGPICVSYKIPLMSADIFEKGQTFIGKDIANMAIKN